jgi:ATPase subunit of ABC transporter with duplicated ATPase domains
MRNIYHSSYEEKMATGKISQFPKNVSVFLVEQEVKGSDETPLEWVKKSRASRDGQDIGEDDESQTVKAIKILNGLGFTPEMQKMATKKLSGSTHLQHIEYIECIQRRLEDESGFGWRSLCQS